MLLNACNIVVTELITNTQQHELLTSTRSRQVCSRAAVFTRPTFSKKCCEASNSVCSKPLHKKFSLAAMYIKSATLHEPSLDDEFCTLLFALCTRLLSEKVQSFDSHCTVLYSAALVLFKEMESAAASTSRTSRDVVKTEVPVPGSEEMIEAQKIHLRCYADLAPLQTRQQKSRTNPSAILLVPSHNRYWWKLPGKHFQVFFLRSPSISLKLFSRSVWEGFSLSLHTFLWSHLSTRPGSIQQQVR